MQYKLYLILDSQMNTNLRTEKRTSKEMTKCYWYCCCRCDRLMTRCLSTLNVTTSAAVCWLLQ